MKINKSNIGILIFGFIMGVLLSGTIVYAVNISSSNIEYDNTKSGLNSTNVEGAITELYQGVNAKLPLNTFGNAQYNESIGARTNGRRSSLTLNNGKYIVAVINGNSGAKGSKNNAQDATQELTCDHNCIISKLSGREYLGNGSSYSFWLRSTLFYVSINEDSSNLSVASTMSTSSTHGQVVSIQAIPINE